jgi:hypothetical protein
MTVLSMEALNISNRWGEIKMEVDSVSGYIITKQVLTVCCYRLFGESENTSATAYMFSRI